ncbi:polysaccharide biosynthesis/export family protein [Piscinibacter sakaiensis]|uniref:polysaccharide biosynthesis/export family protein n=1 Tax=Piscinibacter sakaiensis TaxID=1547922 RepID=UPI003AB04DDE
MIALLSASLLAGCSAVPTSGPSSRQIAATTEITIAGSTSVQVVPVSEAVARQLIARRDVRLFSDTLREPKHDARSGAVGAGDTIEVSIWEAPPATLFGSGAAAPSAGAQALGTSRAVSFPEQVVNRDGTINVPFAGAIPVAGRTHVEIEQEITRRLKGKANQPQVLVRMLRNVSSNVTVVGDVGSSVRVPLGPRNERLLDALAAAGGVRFPVNKMTVQVTRGDSVAALPLDTIIRDPRQNVMLQAGDVITALHEPLSFTSMGATGKNDEINFEAQGISLAQAMARVGGLQDARADAQGVFIFRYEDPQALNWPTQPVGVTADGKVPVIYTINLRDPRSFFVMQTFGVQNKDLLYVSNAPLAEIQKFANVIFSIAFPVVNTINATR